MKRNIMILLTILLIIPAVLVTKQEAHASGFFNEFTRKVRDWAFEKAVEYATNSKDKKIADKATKKDTKEKAPKVSSTVSDTESAGASVSETDLSDETMTPTVHYSAFQDKVSRFISIITVIGGFYLGLSILRSIGMCIISVAQLAMVPDFPKARYFLFKNIMVSMVCIALLGSVGLLTQLVAGVVFHG